MSHTNYNTGESCDCDRPDDSVAHVLDAENFYLWDALDRATRDAVNGVWSVHCDWIVERIVMLEQAGARRPEKGALTLSEETWMLAVTKVRQASSE